MWDVIEHGDNVEERKDRTILASIYQVVLEDVLLMLAEKNLAKVECMWVWNVSRIKSADLKE